MRKLLVLGSDYGTVQVVKEAKQLGLYTIVADLMNNSPTKALADEAWLISTTEIDELAERCRREGVTAVMFGASDFNISNARLLCKRLNLPIYCDNDQTWALVRDKRTFKNVCREVGANVAQDYYLDDRLAEEDLALVQYPVVCKPSDKSGNRGMSYCDNKEALCAGYRNAREISDQPIIIERRLRGPEYNIHYVLADGEARLLYLNATHHQPGQPENLYSFKCTTSSYLKQYIEEMNEAAKRVIRKMGCKEGIVWFDCIRDTDGKFYFLEMGYRFGGVMTYAPYEKVHGFNTVRWMLECALGVKHTKEDLPEELNRALTGCAASYHLFSVEAGKIDRIEGMDALQQMPNVYIDMPKREGDSLRLLTNSGLLGIYGENADELCETVARINEILRIYNESGDNMFIYFNDFETIRKEYYKGLKEFGC
ncbi:MAG: ATP-grasp domain-containing protein [Oscillospiraceae bacterium]|nr:ATP-grasp domain-containing protein [Oscillospiraceae bacterium]